MFLNHMDMNDDDLETWIKVVPKDTFHNGRDYMKLYYVILLVTQQRKSKLRHLPDILAYYSKTGTL